MLQPYIESALILIRTSMGHFATVFKIMLLVYFQVILSMCEMILITMCSPSLFLCRIITQFSIVFSRDF